MTPWSRKVLEKQAILCWQPCLTHSSPFQILTLPLACFSFANSTALRDSSSVSPVNRHNNNNFFPPSFFTSEQFQDLVAPKPPLGSNCPIKGLDQGRAHSISDCISFSLQCYCPTARLFGFFFCFFSPVVRDCWGSTRAFAPWVPCNAALC